MLSAPVLLAVDYQLDDFACGVDSLDDWLKRRAYPNQVNGASRTYVVTEGKRVVGYYCLASGALELSDTPTSIRCNMPDPVPVAILGRLAVDNPVKAEDLGLPYFKMPSFARRKLEVFLAYADFLFMRFQLKQRLSMSIMGSSPHRHNL